MESQTTSPSTFRAGTKPDGEWARIASWVSGRFSRTMRSVNSAPAWRSTSQGRIDQVDHL
jgi:hypothetical protein